MHIENEKNFKTREENIMMCFFDFFKWVKNNITSNWRESCQTRVSIVRREDGVSDWALFIQENGREVRLHRYLMDYYADYADGKPLENIIKSMQKEYEDKVNNPKSIEESVVAIQQDSMEYKDEIRLRGYWCQLSNFYMHLYQEEFRTEEELDACYDAVQALSKLEKLMQEKHSIRKKKYYDNEISCK